MSVDAWARLRENRSSHVVRGPFLFGRAPKFCSSRSTSARSLARPDARLFLSSSRRPMTGMGVGANSASVRPDQHSSNVTPSMSVRMSIRRGLRPIIHIRPLSRSSAAVGAALPRPNSMRALRILSAFSEETSTKTSRSSVSRGSPWPATACPPTSRNLTFCESSRRKNSLQSGLSSILTEPDLPQLLDGADALLESQTREILAIIRFGLFLATGRAQGSFDGHCSFEHTKGRPPPPPLPLAVRPGAEPCG
jgi:hypothetical protein